MEGQVVVFALVLATLAGLSTGIGSAIAVFTSQSNKGFLSGSLGFSAGVMIYISFIELLPLGTEMLSSAMDEEPARWIATAAFFAGLVSTALIDFVVPGPENPHEAMLVEDMGRRERIDLHRIGLLTALAIGIHNFPEGIATFVAGLSEPTIGIAVALAVAMHNIPEGVSVAVPIYYATGSRKRAFWLSFLSGVSEPVGALAAYLVLMPFLSNAVIGGIFAAIAGVMVFVALDQLVPNAKKYGEGHEAVYGLVGGMAIMAITLLMLE